MQKEGIKQQISLWLFTPGAGNLAMSPDEQNNRDKLALGKLSLKTTLTKASK